MSELRLLHVDDEPDIREVVELSLGLDPDFTVRSCASGQAAIEVAADWSPNLILLDVMMPGMDGPTTLAHLHESAKTSEIPVIFMTARAQAREIQHFLSIGARSVISKPFDPLTLAVAVKKEMCRPDERLIPIRERFLSRARNEIIALQEARAGFGEPSRGKFLLFEMQSMAHRLAGCGATLGCNEISAAALILEQVTTAYLADNAEIESVAGAIDGLIDAIACA